MMVFKWIPQNYRTTYLKCNMMIFDTFIIESKELKKTWRSHNKKMFDTDWDFFSWITLVYICWRSNLKKEYSVRYNKIVRHNSQLSKSSKWFKCGKLSIGSKTKMHYTFVGYQENYYHKLTYKRAPLRYSDKDIHVQINQEDKLTILGSELERTKHLNLYVSHTIKIPIENKKIILAGCDLQIPKTTAEFKKHINSGTSLVEAKLITAI